MTAVPRVAFTMRLTPGTHRVNVCIGRSDNVSLIVVSREAWASELVRRATLTEARMTARGSHTRVYVVVEHSRRYRVTMAVVDARYYRGLMYRGKG